MKCTCGAIPVEGMTRHRPDCALNKRDFVPDKTPEKEALDRCRVACEEFPFCACEGRLHS